VSSLQPTMTPGPAKVAHHGVRVAIVALAVAWLLPRPADAERWTRQYINSLPDSAFVVVETTPDGKKLRHLPHHDRSGRVDVSHLRNAMSRLSQVKWADPQHAAMAREHLERHLRELRTPSSSTESGHH
jgi:hypothetical protein